MTDRAIRTFQSDEGGGATVWALSWFIGIIGMCGLALDSTVARHVQAALQATADAAALAAVIDLPDRDTAVATAVTYAERNLAVATNGQVLSPADVEVGSWNHDYHIFTADAANPDAVRVATRRSRAGGNVVPTFFLRIVGLFHWEVTTYAIAQRFIPECLRDGLVAGGVVNMSSLNHFDGDICLHGQQGVDMQIGNYFEDGVTVSMPDLDLLDVPADSVESNPGLYEALRETSLQPRMTRHVGELIDDILALDPAVLPDYADAGSGVTEVDERFDFSTAVPGEIYHLVCADNLYASIAADVQIERLVIVSDCNLRVGEGVEMADVMIAVRAGGNPGAGAAATDIGFASNVVLGAEDDCAEGGGVQIFTDASIHFPSTTTFNGVQIVAAGDVDLGARGEGINGISVQAGGDINMTSDNAFGLCSGGVPQLFTVDYYRLVF